MLCNRCPKSKGEHSLEDFDTNPKTNMLFKTCKECRMKESNRYKDRLNREVPEGYQMCNRNYGHIILKLEEFGWCEMTGDWHKMCKPCRKIVNESRVDDPKDKVRQARWRENNREHNNEREKKRYAENKESIKKRVNDYNKSEEGKAVRKQYILRNDVILSTRSSVTRFINHFEPSNDKFNYWLDCKLSYALKWLHYQLKYKYDIEERDDDEEYHIDHFMPCCTFDQNNEEELKKCFNWRNIQWLTSEDNQIKYNKIPNREEIEERQKTIERFTK